MKKVVPLFFFVLLYSLSFAQQQGIKITKPNNDKELFIKENKRVKIITMDGEKVSGRFTIEDSQSILIKGQVINLSDIESIKRNPLLVSIFTSTFFIYVGAITVGISLIAAAFADTQALWLALPGTALIVTGILSPNFLNKYKVTNDWSFQIINTSQ